MTSIISTMILTGFFSAALLWSVGYLWNVLHKAADMATVD